MAKVRVHNFTITLDGFSAGVNQRLDAPFGDGVDGLHDWMMAAQEDKAAGRPGIDADRVDQWKEGIGATIMGRNMFGPIRGPWEDESWQGWWGDNPPYHYNVYVVTHHPRESVEMEGGTTYHFVTDGIESALDQAKKAAGGKDVMLWGGGQIVQQYLAAGLLDELELHVVPLLLGGGARIFGELGDTEVRLEQIRAVEAPGVTHLKYRVLT